MTDEPGKDVLRRRFRALRDAIPESDRVHRSDVICSLAMTVERLEHAGSVFVYVSAGSEVVTRMLIQWLLDAGKIVAVPRVTAERGIMQPIVIHSQADLAPGRFGIPEPTTHEALSQSPDLAVVPGLAFTRGGRRLGTGGGYYDRYLNSHPATYKVGLCFSEQLADQLPLEEHDVGMDEVITA